MLFDPTAWLRLNREAAEFWFKSAEVTLATGYVLQKRMEMLAEAASDPNLRHLAELGRLLPEKYDAFSRANQAWTDGWAALARGQMASPFLDALNPVHTRVTRNAKRLSKGK